MTEIAKIVSRGAIIVVYLAIGVLGLGAVVWSGIRASDKSEAGFSGLHTELKGLKQVLAQRPLIVIQSPTSPKQPVPPLPHAAIKVTRIDFVAPDPQDGSGDMIARAIYQNLGDITGFAPTVITNAFVGQPITREKFDETMSAERSTAFRVKPPQNTEMEPKGIEAYYNIERIKASDWAAINTGKQTFYAWVTLESTDRNLPKRTAFISEFAIVKSSGIGYQIDRNKAYFHAIKPR